MQQVIVDSIVFLWVLLDHPLSPLFPCHQTLEAETLVSKFRSALCTQWSSPRYNSSEERLYRNSWWTDPAPL